MKFAKSCSRAVMVAATLTSAVVYAHGGSGVVVPTYVAVESGNVYVSGDFQNPDQCATSSVVVLQAKDADELNRMLSVAMTAMLSNRKISMWLVECVPVPWFPTAPLATSIGFGR